MNGENTKDPIERKVKTMLDDEIDRFAIDALDKPAVLKKAKEHGSAQKVNFIPDEFPAESK